MSTETYVLLICLCTALSAAGSCVINLAYVDYKVEAISRILSQHNFNIEQIARALAANKISCDFPVVK